MATNPFPPQAYTRDTLIKAFEWLQTQSPQVRELATTNDLLISLFTKSQMQGKDALELPQLASFKNELRSLAGQMGKFEEEAAPAAPIATPSPAATMTGAATAPPMATPKPPVTAPVATAPTPLPTAAPPAQGQISLNMATRPAAPNVNLVLDPKSQAWLEEIQRELNLESPAEALRLAVSVGYGRLSELFPKR
ncbi:MAG: hypothetical protein KF767_02085 [Bdellovibrionaceae bacterium]|nr:hypothetical protein [Pseudobdellovibrionaceae bacterium]